MWMAVPQFALAGDPTMERSDPQAGSEVNVPPTEIKLWFSDAIDPLCRSIKVEDSKGNEVDDGDTHAADDDPKELIVTIPDRLYDGQYTVTWDITTVDCKENSGSFKFTVNIKD